MTKDQIRRWLTSKELILVRGPRGGLGSPWRTGGARKVYMDHLTDELHKLISDLEFTHKTAMKIQENLITSYKKEIEQLKSIVLSSEMDTRKLNEQIEDIKKRGTPCERCGTTGTVVKDGDDSHMCPDCMGIGML